MLLLLCCSSAGRIGAERAELSPLSLSVSLFSERRAPALLKEPRRVPAASSGAQVSTPAGPNGGLVLCAKLQPNGGALVLHTGSKGALQGANAVSFEVEVDNGVPPVQVQLTGDGGSLHSSSQSLYSLSILGDEGHGYKRYSYVLGSRVDWGKIQEYDSVSFQCPGSSACEICVANVAIE